MITLSGLKRHKPSATAVLAVALIGGIGTSVALTQSSHNTAQQPTTATATPVGPVDTAIQPNDSVMTYIAMQDSWNLHSVADQETMCVAWDGGSIPDGNRWVTVTKNSMIAKAMHNATPEMADYMVPGVVAQFFDDTCDALWNDGTRSVGSAESIPSHRHHNG